MSDRRRALTLVVSVALILGAVGLVGWSAPRSLSKRASEAALHHWLATAAQRHSAVRPAEEFKLGLTLRLRRTDVQGMTLVGGVSAWMAALAWVAPLQRRRQRTWVLARHVDPARAPPLQLA
jgi:hypothetical protein